MNAKKFLALFGATVSLSLVPVGAALAAGTTVSVRVEGLKKTLLFPTVIHTHAGWITRFGAPTGDCPATSGQGALDVATHHRWAGKWTTQFGPEYEITSIFGESHPFSSKYFWEIFVNNVAASAGACEINLHRGEQLLFAAVPQTGAAYPLKLSVLTRPVAGRPFKVKVAYYGPNGKAKPLAGATVTAGGVSAQPVPHSAIKARTNAHGIASLTEPRLGLMILQAAGRGYIRSAPVIRDVI
jgi:hypothetical protein